MASHGDVAEGGANEEFSDIIKWRSGMFIFFKLVVPLNSPGVKRLQGSASSSLRGLNEYVSLQNKEWFVVRAKGLFSKSSARNPVVHG